MPMTPIRSKASTNTVAPCTKVFGPRRLFWGTDITKMPCSWRQCVTMFTEELPWLGHDDKRLVMGDAVCAWWGWDRAA
jgi:hypothetical protein